MVWRASLALRYDKSPQVRRPLYPQPTWEPFILIPAALEFLCAQVLHSGPSLSLAALQAPPPLLRSRGDLECDLTIGRLPPPRGRGRLMTPRPARDPRAPGGQREGGWRLILHLWGEPTRRSLRPTGGRNRVEVDVIRSGPALRLFAFVRSTQSLNFCVGLMSYCG